MGKIQFVAIKSDDILIGTQTEYLSLNKFKKRTQQENNDGEFN